MATQASTDGHFRDGTYDYDGRLKSGAAPIESGPPVWARFDGDDRTGHITSGTLRWKSGDTSTQHYRDGRLQATDTTDPSGKLLQSPTYAYNPDDGYGVTVRNGEGQVIQQSDFNADQSGMETRFDKNN